jgi:glutaminase
MTAETFDIQSVLELAVQKVRRNHEGEPPRYIPELAEVPLGTTSAALTLCDGSAFSADDDAEPKTGRLSLESRLSTSR